MEKNIIVITGPTASGKTKLAITLAKKIDAEIICADSRTIYKDFDIVSAKPEKKERENIKHHLLDIVNPNDSFSAGDFAKSAINVINKSKAKNIIVSGGSWFYIKSFLGEKTLLDCPSDPKLRKALEKLTTDELYRFIKNNDINRALEIHPNNRDKLIRAVEMYLLLGKPVSSIERKDNENHVKKWYVPDIERDELYKRIDKRVDTMIEKGLYKEWERNKEKYPNSIVIRDTIGYKEFFDLEEGIYKDFTEACEKIKQHTRNFAKRQLTYFRNANQIEFIKDEKDILADLQCLK